MSCWWRLRLHHFCGGRWLKAAFKTRCKSNELVRTIFKFECCNCGKAEYYTCEYNRLAKMSIDWPRTAELALQGERG